MTTKEWRRRLKASWARRDALNLELKDPLSIGRLCQLAGVTHQLVNTYQRLGLVRSPNDRRRGRRQVYNSLDLEQVVSSKFLAHFFQLKEVVGIKRLEDELLRCGARLPWPRGRNGVCEVQLFFYPRVLRFRHLDLERSHPQIANLMGRYLGWRVRLKDFVNPMERGDLTDRATTPFVIWHVSAGCHE